MIEPRKRKEKKTQNVLHSGNHIFSSGLSNLFAEVSGLFILRL